MSPIWCFVLLFLRLKSVHSSSSRIEIGPDGGYTGISIKIQEDVPRERCSQILRDLESTLKRASDVLFDAFDKRVYFKRITVIVPSGWSNTGCKISSRSPSWPFIYGEPDIYVTLKGEHLKTTRSKGCGLSGDWIEFPYSLLESREISARTLVSEWAKYRYGVFEEHGFPGDPLYPVFYEEDDGTVFPSGNTDNLSLKGKWKKDCDPQKNEDCVFEYSDESEVRCSLGFLPFLSNVTKFCPDNQNMKAVRGTKQFSLCEGKSSNEIIFAHSDFQNLPSSLRHPHPSSTTVISFVQEPETKYVLLMEASSRVAQSGLWKWISKAAQKFIRYDLPKGSKISIVTYSNETSVAATPTILHDERIRARLADQLPPKHKVQASSEISNVTRAYDDVLNMIQRDGSAGTTIILIKRNLDDEGLNYAWERKLLDYVRKNLVKISTILFRDSHQSEISSPPHPFYDSLSDISGGKTFLFDVKIGTTLYFDLISSLTDILLSDKQKKEDPTPVIVHSAVSNGMQPLSANFTVDTSLGHDTSFGILVNDAENYNVKSVTFWDVTGTVYGPYQSLSSDYNVINMKTINFLQNARRPPFDDDSHRGTTWRYRVEWFSENSHGGDENVAIITSKPDINEAKDITIRVWLSSDSSNDRATDLHPLSIYARVTLGETPVLSALVTAQIYVLKDDGSGSMIELQSFELLDNGSGGPDLTKNDGIYSRYVTSYNGTGRYQFRVLVKDESGTSFTMKAHENSSFSTEFFTTPFCCGSRVPAPLNLRSPIGPFRREIAGPVVHLLEVPSREKDLMAPSRIKDLLISNSKEGLVKCEWTAPGNNFDSGSVAGYRFVLTDYSLQIKDTIHELRRSDEGGKRVSESFRFPVRGEEVLVGLISVDESGNEGKISNIVPVYIPSDPVTSSPPPPGPLINGGDSDWVTVGIICGILGTLLLIFFIILFIFVRRRKRGETNNNNTVKSSGVNVDLQHSSDSSSYESDIKNSSSNNLVPSISTISNSYKGKTSFGHGLTPTYWSASQLLREHEERQQRPAMGSIAEEDGYYNRALESDPEKYYRSTIVPSYDNGIIVEDEDEIIINGMAGVPKSSNSSSSTLGIIASNNVLPSLHGSSLSVNTTKTRNITQV